ncbi:hypothetical protein CTI12_AA151050 [Artemisia annua]|uniref:DUF4220 domain-containing protein n=1 Tax=Artemisia annua TaxID=35608 RepID=A0A2U1PHN3_ARTAN|nr:hypothetical protein CTI12_AA151050 [Artemisia annua]
METAKEISSARGDWVLRVEQGWRTLLPYTLDFDYDKSLLWHIATQLCSNKELKKELNTTASEVRPLTVKGDRSKSLLFYGCIFAKMMKIEEKEKSLNKWSIISKVWVELLCYAASHSRADSKAAQVSKGGELITMVWLLMAHFGLGGQFQINEGQARAKLIVGK